MDAEAISKIVRQSVQAELAKAGLIDQFISLSEAKRRYGAARIEMMIDNGQIRRYKMGNTRNSKVNLKIEEILQAELKLLR